MGERQIKRNHILKELRGGNKEVLSRYGFRAGPWGLET